MNIAELRQKSSSLRGWTTAGNPLSLLLLGLQYSRDIFLTEIPACGTHRTQGAADAKGLTSSVSWHTWIAQAWNPFWASIRAGGGSRSCPVWASARQASLWGEVSASHSEKAPGQTNPAVLAHFLECSTCNTDLRKGSNPTSSPRATKYLRQPPNLGPLPQHLSGQPQKPTTRRSHYLPPAPTPADCREWTQRRSPVSPRQTATPAPAGAVPSVPQWSPRVCQWPHAMAPPQRPPFWRWGKGPRSAILGQQLRGPAWLRPRVLPWWGRKQ